MNEPIYWLDFVECDQCQSNLLRSAFDKVKAEHPHWWVNGIGIVKAYYKDWQREEDNLITHEKKWCACFDGDFGAVIPICAEHLIQAANDVNAHDKKEDK